MIKVRFLSSWCGDGEMLETMNLYTQDGNYQYKDIKCVTDDSYDYCVVFNNANISVRKNRCIIFCCEPRYVKPEFFNLNKKEYYCVYDKHTLCVPFVGTPYRELIKKNIVKTEELSAVISSAYQQKLHRLRRDFLINVLYKEFPNIKHWGGGFSASSHEKKQFLGPIGSKQDALFPFLYTFNCESVDEKNYYTEKIVDPILCETLCFYHGDNIVDDIFPESFVSKLPHIKRSKLKLINDLNPFNIVKNIIEGKIT